MRKRKYSKRKKHIKIKNRTKKVSKKTKKKLTKKRSKIKKSKLYVQDGGIWTILLKLSDSYRKLVSKILCKDCMKCYKNYMIHPIVWYNKKQIDGKTPLRKKHDVYKYFKDGPEALLERKLEIEGCGECVEEFRKVFIDSSLPFAVKLYMKKLGINTEDIQNNINTIKSISKELNSKNIKKFLDKGIDIKVNDVYIDGKINKNKT